MVMYTVGMKETTFERERRQSHRAHRYIVGIDEAGRGPLAGPVVAAAAAYRDQEDFIVHPDQEPLMRFVRDSKTLSEKQREEMYEFVTRHFFIGEGIVYPETIDRINILEASFLAMKEAIGNLRRGIAEENGHEGHKNTFFLLVDGNMAIPNCSYEQEAIISGDASVRSIAAASIVAKVTRDRMMLAYDREFPAYGFAKHKGYGTKEHMEALRRFGPSPIHRMSFRPVFYSIPENVNRNLLSRKK